eukprot:935726-Pelagomonas_calceolata.AAC.1
MSTPYVYHSTPYAYHEHASLEHSQALNECITGVDVKVIAGLIQQQDVRLGPGHLQTGSGTT